MPELPEVETTLKGLKLFVGINIKIIKLHTTSLRYAIPKKIPIITKNSKIQSIYRIAKYIIIELDRVNKSLQIDKAKFHRLFMEKRYNETVQQLNRAENKLLLFQHEHNTLNLAEQTKATIKVAAEIKSQIL